LATNAVEHIIFFQEIVKNEIEIARVLHGMIGFEKVKYRRTTHNSRYQKLLIFGYGNFYFPKFVLHNGKYNFH